MAGPEIQVKITGDAAGATRALADVNAGLEDTSKKAKTFGEKLRDLGNTKVGDLAAGVRVWGQAFTEVKNIATGVFHSLVGDTMNYAETVDKLNLTTGISTKELQRLGFAASQNKSSLEGIGTAMRMMSRGLQEAANGSKEFEEKFKRAGISIRDGAGQLKSQTQLFYEIADSMAATTDGSKRQAMAMDLLGRAGAELVPLMSQGSAAIKALGDRAEATGQVLEDKTIKNVANFNDQMAAMKDSWRQVAAVIIDTFLPALTEAGEGLEAFFSKGSRGVAGKRAFVEELFGITDEEARAAEEAWATQEIMLKNRTKLEEMANSDIAAILEDRKKTYAEKMAAIEEVWKKHQAIADKVNAGQLDAEKKFLYEMSLQIAERKKQIEAMPIEARPRAIKALEEAVNSASQMPVAVKQLWIQMIADVNAAMDANVDATLGAYEHMRTEMKKIEEKAVADTLRAYEKMLDDRRKAEEKNIDATMKAYEDLPKRRFDAEKKYIEDTKSAEAVGFTERVRMMYEHLKVARISADERKQLEKQVADFAIAEAERYASDTRIGIDDRIRGIQQVVVEYRNMGITVEAIERRLADLQFERFKIEKEAAFGRIDDIKASEESGLRMKLAYLEKYRAAYAGHAERLKEYEKELFDLQMALRDAIIKRVEDDFRSGDARRQKDMQKDLADARADQARRRGMGFDTENIDKQVADLETKLLDRREREYIKFLKRQKDLSLDDQREALEQFLKHELEKGEISKRTRRKIERELAEIERQRAQGEFDKAKQAGKTTAKSLQEFMEEKAAKEEKERQEEIHRKDEEARQAKQKELDQIAREDMAAEQRQKMRFLLEDILSAIKALKLISNVTVNCTCVEKRPMPEMPTAGEPTVPSGPGASGGGGGGPSGGGGSEVGNAVSQMSNLTKATKSAEDAKKSLAENIKSEFSPGRPGNATYSLAKGAEAAEQFRAALADAAAHVADAGGATPPSGTPSVDGGAGGDGGDAGGGVASADGGGKAGAGGKGGDGGKGGKGSKSSGGGGGGAGGAGGAGGRGGDAVVTIIGGGASGPGWFSSAVGAHGAGNYGVRSMMASPEARMRDEIDSAIRSGNPMAIAAVQRKYPWMFPAGPSVTERTTPASQTSGARRPGSSYIDASGRLVTVPSDGGGAGSTPRIRIDDDRPVRTRVVPDPEQAAFDLARYKGGLTTTRKVEEIARMLYGATTTGGALKTIDAGGLKPPGGSGIISAGGRALFPTINVNLAGANISSPADAKKIATAIGREVNVALRMPSMRTLS